MAEEILWAEGLAKSYARMSVLKGLDLTLMKGERYVLFGQNGAGKSTLVKILATVMPPDTGELDIFGMQAGKNRKSIRKRIGMMTHDPFLYEDLTPIENLNFYAGLYGMENPGSRIKQLLKDVRLYHRANDRVGVFSRGMKQRLGLARVLLHEPDLILLDEPYAGLDIKGQEFLNNIIIEQSKAGKTIFVITHDVPKGIKIASRAGVLTGGKIMHEAKKPDAGFPEEFMTRIQEAMS